ncbi:MAG: nucleoside-diphosphate sugar epimerase, partial [Bacteroidales bacterium]|nr:nucleoside-diphosphate sugar epimerase [Bacteroidales bacterium]
LLACILGRSGEVFFPKLDEGQMLTFSSICDDFLKAEGLRKMECRDDAEARLFASQMPYGSGTCPVVYSGSDTTGEKPFEEFYVPGESTDMGRFHALGVIEAGAHRPMAEVEAFFEELETLFRGNFTKEDVVAAIRGFVPNFEHEEKGRNLDEKM